MKKIKIYICIVFFILTIGISRSVYAKENAKLEPGIYEIYTCVNDTKVIHIQDENLNSQANVQIYERKNSKAQKFEIQLNKDGSYCIIATHSKKALDVQEGGCTVGTNVWQYELNDTNAQKWNINIDSNGYYTIQSKLNGLYLDVEYGIGNDRQNIQVYTKNNTNAQRFRFIKVNQFQGTQSIEDGIYNIYSRISSDRVLEIPNSETNNEVNLRTNRFSNKANQKFKIEYNNDGTYSILSLHSRKSLDVKYAGNTNCTKVQQYDSNKTNAQKWIIHKNTDGTYCIVSKQNDLCLDIAWGNSSIGADVQTYHYNGTNSQKFDIKKCEVEKGTKSLEDGLYSIISYENNNKQLSYSNNMVSVIENVTKNDNLFEFTYLENGYYKINIKDSNKVLTVEKSGNVIESEFVNLDTQKWILKRNSKNVYNIINKSSGQYIDLENNSISLQYENDTSFQKFIFIKELSKEDLAYVEDGIYEIKTLANKNFDISEGSYKDDANLQIWEKANNQQQKFRISRVKDQQYYKITCVNSAKILSSQAGVTKLFSNVYQIYDYNSESQYWGFKKNENGNYNIISVSNGLVLDVNEGNIGTNGENVQLYYDNGTDAQKFILSPINIINNNIYEIETKLDTNKILDVCQDENKENKNIQIWDANNSDNQRFRFEAISTDTYKITEKNTNKAITLNESTSNVYESIYKSDKSQQWEIKEAGEGYYNIVSRLNGKVIDIKEGVSRNGQNVQVYSLNGTDAQKFRFVTGYRKFYEVGAYGKTGLVIKGDLKGQDLKYYKIGKGPNVFFGTFAIHGWEDDFSYDGQELTKIAESFKERLLNMQDENLANKWTIYILPSLNPDGEYHGWSHNGPGRTTLYSAAPNNQGIDMNRTWSAGWTKYKTQRNYNGTEPFQAYEARYVRDFLLSHKSTNGQTVLVDLHGWLNETIGDDGIGWYYRSELGMSKHIATYGRGYLVNWARANLGSNGRVARSALVELPEAYSSAQVASWGLGEKYINATINMLRGIL